MEVPQISSQLGLFFDEIDFIALLCELEAGRHPGHAASDDQSLGNDGHHQLVKGSNQPGIGHGHSDEVLGLFRGLLLLAHVDPGALISDIGHLEEKLVQPRFPDRLPKHGLVGPRRAGGDDHTVQFVLCDGILDLFLGILGAGVEIFIHIDDILQRAGILLHRGNIHHPSDIDPAMADEDPDPGFLPGDVHLRRIFLSW